RLGWRVDTHEDHFRIRDCSIEIRREREIPSERGFQDLLESGLVDRRDSRLPRSHTFGVDVSDDDVNVRAKFRNHGHRWAADIPCPDAQNVSDHYPILTRSGERDGTFTAGAAVDRLLASQPRLPWRVADRASARAEGRNERPQTPRIDTELRDF